MTHPARSMQFAKGRHRYVFRYRSGQESALLNRFADLAERDDTSFDWFDAAVLSYQLGKRLHPGADAVAERRS